MIDSQLLERFVVQHDPAAFQELVDRHGPAVLRACRRHLHDPHEAEDALQATFLILLRRAPSIRDPELLNRWLVGVARRVAMRARQRGVARSEHERRWANMHPEACEQDNPLLDLRRVVREEMATLPEVSRQALSACYLQGLTHEEAARRLGWPVGTVKVRLVRGRRQLRERLDRRGVALSVAFLLLLLRRKASASLTPEAINATVEAMNLAAAGEVASLRAKFPRALEMARWGRGLGGPVHWGTTGLIILAFLLISSCGVTLGNWIKTEQRRSAEASSKFAKVLEVDCR